MITAERDADHGPDAVRRLLPLLGRIGKHNGAQTGILAEDSADTAHVPRRRGGRAACRRPPGLG